LILFLLLAKIKGEGAGIFIVLVKKISEPSSVKMFFSHEKESKTFVSHHVEQKYIFPQKQYIDYSNSAAQYFFF
jgi:hypothetical protein